ncbi:hypothetical protein M3Y97_00985100 [Aphelenchoides bicaudatus]|nr:hypothetical protein M3Y97_00985100 [Aphelenchoides bicaudatus]
MMSFDDLIVYAHVGSPSPVVSPVANQPLEPFMDFLPDVGFKKSGLQIQPPNGHRFVYSRSTRSREDWTSSRPCFEFMTHRTCRYGSKCRFSHDLTHH